MGGAAGGEIASNLAVQTFLQTARQELRSGTRNPDHIRNSLQRAAAAANRTVRMRGRYDSALRGRGTTLVAVCVEASTAHMVNVGDSRAYLIRGGEARQVTEDHSYVAESVRRGVMTVEEAEQSPMHSVITRAIGAEDDVNPDVFSLGLETDDVLLLASDGLTRHLSDADIATIVSTPGQSAVECCRRLIEMAKDDGGSDNITCLVIRVRDEAHASSGSVRPYR